MRGFLRVFAVLLLAVASGTLSAQQPAGSEAPLTNANVVNLMVLGLGNDVVIAKVNQVAAVNFDLSPDGLAKLKSDGVSTEVIAAMLKRATPPSQQPQPAFLAAPDARSFSPKVRLRSKGSEIDLVGRRGAISAVWAFVTMLTFQDYPGAASKIRIADPRPPILAHLQDDPKDRQGRNEAFLVKLDPSKRDDKRSLKIGKATRYSFGGSFGSPDSDWTLPFDAEQESPGVWRIVPKADLKPGEYGFFIMGTLFDFAVDM